MDLQGNFDPSIAAHSALLAKAKSAAQNQGGHTDAKLQKVAQDFEAMFVNIMLKEMRKTVPKGGLLSDDAGSKIYRELMDTALSEAIAKSKTFGLCQKFYEQLRQNAARRGHVTRGDA